MLVTAFEVVLVIVGLALVVLGIYGIVREKWPAQAAGGAAGANINIPLSGLILIIGMCSLGFGVYLRANAVANNPAVLPNVGISASSSALTISTSSASINISPSASSITSPAPPTNTILPTGIPSITIDTPKNGTTESRAGSFTVGGTASSLRSNTIWIIDYDASGYTIDEQANVDHGRWSATDGPPLGTSDDTLTQPGPAGDAISKSRLCGWRPGWARLLPLEDQQSALHLTRTMRSDEDAHPKGGGYEADEAKSLNNRSGRSRRWRRASGRQGLLKLPAGLSSAWSLRSTRRPASCR